MDRRQWHNWRKEGIGSSDAAILMGVSPYKSAYHLYLEKVSTEDVVEYNTVATSHGKEHEPIVRSWLEDTFHLLLKEDWVIGEESSWMRASLDAVSLDGKQIYEIKCPYSNEKDHLLAKKGEIPEKYYPQVQHQMMVTGAKEITYVSFFRGDYQLCTVKRDDKYIKKLKEVEKNFWENHVLARCPPEKDTVYEEINSPEWESLASKWESTHTQLGMLKDEEAELREKMISFGKGRNISGNGVKILKVEKEGRIDYKEAYLDLLELLGSDLPDLYQPLSEYKKSPTTEYRISAY